GSVRFGELIEGIMRVGSDGFLSSGLLDLTADVTGMLPVVNGGTGSNTLNNLITLGTMATGNVISTITGNPQISVSGSGSEAAAVTIAGVGDSIGDSQLQFDT